MSSQPTPKVTGADVGRVVCRDFPADNVKQVLSILGEYGVESWHRESDRVRLAVLKLAAGNMERIRQGIEVAKRDYRDVLAAAEYPSYFLHVPLSGALPPDQEQRIIDTDWKQYREWLDR